MELLAEKPYESITVSDVARKADLNRGTFYAHFDNVDDLTRSAMADTADTISEFLSQAVESGFLEDPLPALTQVGEYLDQNRELTRKLVESRSIESFVFALESRFREWVQQAHSREHAAGEEGLRHALTDDIAGRRAADLPFLARGGLPRRGDRRGQQVPERVRAHDGQGAPRTARGEVADKDAARAPFRPVREVFSLSLPARGRRPEQWRTIDALGNSSNGSCDMETKDFTLHREGVDGDFDVTQYGTAGRPVIAFSRGLTPSWRASWGKVAWSTRWRDSSMPGRVRLFCVDSADDASWYAGLCPSGLPSNKPWRVL